MTARVPLNWWWLGAIAFAAIWMAHAAIWRLASPRRDVRLLFLMCLLPPLVLSPWLAGAGVVSLAPLVVYLVLAANYLAVYPALQASSPTLRLMVLAASASGMTLEELERALAGDSLREARLKDLERGRLVASRRGELSLRPAGRWLAAFFVTYRRFLGLPQGEG